jgi:RHS repeat-associated protein
LNQDRAGNFRFYAYDGLGSTRALTDDAGAVTDTYDYEAFGEVLNETGDTDNNYKFTGEQFDTSLDQYYLRARYYDQGVGRFTQQDTYMGNNFDPVSLHKYLYANAAPTMYTDPTGNFSVSGMMSTLNVMARLSSLAQTSVSVFNIATGETELSARQIATELLLSKLPIGVVKRLYAKGCTKQKNSFIPGTLVYSDNGLVPIETLNIGDSILSFNEETGIYEYKYITHLITGERTYKLFTFDLANGGEITTTEEHPFYVSGAWLNAKDITIDHALTSKNSSQSIETVSTALFYTKVYNITVEDNHNYLVGSGLVLTHNANDLCDFVTSKVDPSKVRNALGAYKGRTWQVGGVKFRLTKERMKHILERHHPEFFDVRKAKGKNSSLPSSWSLQDVESAVLAGINQHRGAMIKAGSGATKQFEVHYLGRRFMMGVNRGRIGQFYPLD